MNLWFPGFAKYHNPKDDEPLGERPEDAVDVDDSRKDICLSVSRGDIIVPCRPDQERDGVGAGLDISIDNDDVNPREVRAALRKLADDLEAAGWRINFTRGRG